MRGKIYAIEYSSCLPKNALTGRIISGLAALFLLFDRVIKVIQHPEAVRPTVQLDYAESLVFGIGLIELVCLIHKKESLV